MDHRRELEAGCYVIDQADLDLQRKGNLAWAQVIGERDQATALSLFYLESRPGTSPAITTGESEAVLYLQSGSCRVFICAKPFEVKSGDGLYVRNGEHFSFENNSGEPAVWLASFCPLIQGLAFTHDETTQFDERYPVRRVKGRQGTMHETEGRYYRLLAGPSVGSEKVTQFIGRIPPSKAPEHFHLYEETICVLSGSGRMWNGAKCTEVRPGSMIFLPRQQAHSLECLSEDGMELMGVFYPAGSPAINYKT